MTDRMISILVELDKISVLLKNKDADAVFKEYGTDGMFLLLRSLWEEINIE